MDLDQAVILSVAKDLGEGHFFKQNNPGDFFTHKRAPVSQAFSPV
jgi:hypothetical protein